MPKLTDTQLVILSTASQRDDGAVLPLARSLSLNKGAAEVVLQSLLRRRLIAEHPDRSGDLVWRSGNSERRVLAITDAGLAAIGVADSPIAGNAPAMRTSVLSHVRRALFGNAPSSAKGTTAGSVVRPETLAPEKNAMPDTYGRPDRGGGVHAVPSDVEHPGQQVSAIQGDQASTKTALIIKFLKRPQGGTIAELMAATGWQAHSVRGAISGRLRRRLGLMIAASADPDRGRVYRLSDCNEQSKVSKGSE